MTNPLNEKDYVTFARRFVKETVATMDIEELRGIVTTIYMRRYRKERTILVRRVHLKKCKHGIRTYSILLQRITI